MFAPIPKWIKEMEERKCFNYGKLVVCVSGTKEYPFHLGEKTSYVKVCVGRTDKRLDDYFCFRILAGEHLGKEGLREIGGDTIIALIDYPMDSALMIDRSQKEKYDYHVEVDEHSIKMRTVHLGKGKVYERKWII